MERQEPKLFDVHQTEDYKILEKISKTHKIMYIGLFGYFLWPLFVTYIWVIFQMLKLKKMKLSSEIANIVINEISTSVMSIICYVIALVLFVFMDDNFFWGGAGIVVYIGGLLFVLHKTITNGKLIKQTMKKKIKQQKQNV